MSYEQACDASHEPIEVKLIAAASDGHVVVTPEKCERIREILKRAALASSGTNAQSPQGEIKRWFCRHCGREHSIEMPDEAPALPPRDEQSVTISHPFCQKCGAPHAAIRCRHCIEQIGKEVLEEAAQLCFQYAVTCGDSAEEYTARRLGDAIRRLADSRRK